MRHNASRIFTENYLSEFAKACFGRERGCCTNSSSHEQGFITCKAAAAATCLCEGHTPSVPWFASTTVIIASFVAGIAASSLLSALVVVCMRFRFVRI